MRVFITGIAGFLGSHIADALIRQGHEVRGVDSLIGGYADNVPGEAEWRAVDCQYLSTMTELMAGCELVIHTACTAYEGLSVFSPHLVTMNTSQISATVFTAAVRNNVRRIVNCSSMSRYGANPVPFTEDQRPSPEDPYAIAKVAAEELLFNMADTFGFEPVNLVPHNIVGPRQKYDDPYRNVVSIMANRMLRGEAPVIYGDGEQTRCFSDVRELVDCFVAACFQENVVYQTINVGPEEGACSINDLASILAPMCKFDGDPIYYPDRPREVKHAHCSAQKAKDLLDYEQIYSLEDTCWSIVKYIEERGPKPFQYHLPVEIQNDLTPETWTKRKI